MAALEVARREGKSLTVDAFCVEQGYVYKSGAAKGKANKSGLRHFPRLKIALHEYAVGGGSSSVSRQSVSRAELAEQASVHRELDRLRREVGEVGVLQERVKALESEAETYKAELQVARGVLSAWVSYSVTVQRDRVGEIERELAAAAKALLGTQEQEAVPTGVAAPAPVLTLVRGDS